MKTKLNIFLCLLLLALCSKFNVLAQEDVISEDSLYPVSLPEDYRSISLPEPSPLSGKINKISLDFKGMDIIDALKMISQRAGFNIIVGKNVQGKVTIFLKEVNIQDAFEIILASNNLAYENREGILYVMSDRDYELSNGEKFGSKRQILTKTLEFAKAADLSKTLTQIKSSIGNIVVDEGTNTIVAFDTPEKLKTMEIIIYTLDKPIITRIFELKYAQADKISAKIQESVSKGAGSVKLDERTNKIAVSDYPNKISEIAKIIEAFDEKPLQVRIDAQIIEISPEKDEFKMGVDWDAWISKNLRLTNPLSTGVGNKLSLGLATSTTALGEKYDTKGVLDLLRTIGKTKILSSPTIMAINNQEAKILVGTKEAYITSTTSQSGSGTSNISQEVNFVDVGIKLYVTPTINKNGFVTMKIKPEVSSSKTTSLTSEGKTTDVPIVTTSEAETTVSLKDGATIVIAGLKKDKKEKEIKKIPLLGDVPILGALFRSVSAATNKTELVIFITPRIVLDNNPPPYTTLTQDKDILGISQGNNKPKVTPLEPSLKAEYKSEARGSPGLTNISSNYSEHIREKISSILGPLNNRALYKGKALVSFVILSNGELSGEPEIVSSTAEELNAPTINIIKSASPYPNFPKAMNKIAERFQLSILYE